MNRSFAMAAWLLLGFCALFPSLAHAEEWHWCVAGDLLDSGQTNGPNLLAQPFRAENAPDFQGSYEAHARAIIGTVQGEFVINCSPAFADAQAAATHRAEWVASMGGLIVTMDVNWTPDGARRTATGADGSGSLDGTGALGKRAYCMLQETIDGQPRALFSLVFTPPELESDYDAAMARRFIEHAQALYSARPDATATCHRHDSEASAHDMRNHEAEMRRIKGWTVVTTTWSD